MLRHLSHTVAATPSAAAVLLHLTVIFWLCCTGVTAAPAFMDPMQLEGELSAIFPRYDTEVQDLLGPAVALGLGPIGGSLYVSSNSSNSNASSLLVCARADVNAMIAPVTLSTADALFHSITGGVSGQLDVHHGCYMANTQGTLPQCVAMLTSTAADCGGVAADAVGPHLEIAAHANSTGTKTVVGYPKVLRSTASMLANYVYNWSHQRLKLERSLRRTREATTALARVQKLMQNAAAISPSEEEDSLLRARATAHVAKVVSEANNRIMDKHRLWRDWMLPSLGIISGITSDENRNLVSSDSDVAYGPDVSKCPLYDYTSLLFWGYESMESKMSQHLVRTLEMVDLLHLKKLKPALRGLQCVQMMSVTALMILEDEPVRTVAKMLSKGYVKNTTIWDLEEFDILAANYSSSLRDHQLWILAYMLAVVGTPEVADELFGGTAVVDCMRRAALVVPDNFTGTVPPSLAWCLYNTPMNETTQGSVRQRSLVTRESSAVAPNGQCLWGLSVWNGLCDGVAFDPSQCNLCPPGSVGDGEGHCVCGDASGMYATLTKGCVPKEPANDVPGVRIHDGGRHSTIPLSGDNASVTLLSVQLPRTAILFDPSAYLRVDVVCHDSGRGSGGTQLVATRSGNRKPPCASVVAYERQRERTGVMHTFLGGTQRFVTYAESLIISATGTAAFYGETCRVNVTVASTLRRNSQPVTAGTWTFVPGATPLHLELHGVNKSTASGVNGAKPLPRCQGVGAKVYATSMPAAVHAGVCRVSGEQLGVFAAAGDYSLFGRSIQQAVSTRVRHSAGVAQDAAFISTVQSLAARTAMEVILEGGGATDSDVLWSVKINPGVTPLAVNAWRSGGYANVSLDTLRLAHSLRVRFADTMDTSAFAPAGMTVPFRYEDGQGGANDVGSEMSASSGIDHKTTSVAIERHRTRYLVAIILLSLVFASLVALFIAFLYLLFKTDKWPKFLLT
ncbi:hypothetical protein JKF63_05623 [Porcisia hertigi]|uniref:Uncharacterized protein n=1 Tax=Porcisia hertigi TaxID=2761500 RepID=A0A836I5X1_9TRYP|nr:hypothetical protein JKF63_05623 [Porcisia hertigi]